MSTSRDQGTSFQSVVECRNDKPVAATARRRVSRSHLHSNCYRLDISLADYLPRSVVSRCSGSGSGVANGSRTQGLFARLEQLLRSSCSFAIGVDSHADANRRRENTARSSYGLAVE